MYESGTDGLKGRLLFTVEDVGQYGTESDNHNSNRVFLAGDNPLSHQDKVKLAIQDNHLIRCRITNLDEESFEDDRDRVEAVVALGQQVISADQFLEEAEKAVYEGCDRIVEMGGSTCVRK